MFKTIFGYILRHIEQLLKTMHLIKQYHNCELAII